MANNFDLKKYLIENKLTPLSKHSKEHPDFIRYRGIRYRRIGLVNEIEVKNISPTYREFTIFKTPDTTPGEPGVDYEAILYKDTVHSSTALGAFKVWFDGSGEKYRQMLDGGELMAKDADDFLDNVNDDNRWEHGKDLPLNINDKVLTFDVLKHPTDLPVYFIFHGRLPQEDIDTITAMKVYGNGDNNIFKDADW